MHWTFLFFFFHQWSKRAFLSSSPLSFFPSFFLNQKRRSGVLCCLFGGWSLGLNEAVGSCLFCLLVCASVCLSIFLLECACDICHHFCLSVVCLSVFLMLKFNSSLFVLFCSRQKESPPGEHPASLLRAGLQKDAQKSTRIDPYGSQIVL